MSERVAVLISLPRKARVHGDFYTAFRWCKTDLACTVGIQHYARLSFIELCNAGYIKLNM